jgi:hypothetical protein
MAPTEDSVRSLLPFNKLLNQAIAKLPLVPSSGPLFLAFRADDAMVSETLAPKLEEADGHPRAVRLRSIASAATRRDIAIRSLPQGGVIVKVKNARVVNASIFSDNHCERELFFVPESIFVPVHMAEIDPKELVWMFGPTPPQAGPAGASSATAAAASAQITSKIIEIVVVQIGDISDRANVKLGAEEKEPGGPAATTVQTAELHVIPAKPDKKGGTCILL